MFHSTRGLKKVNSFEAIIQGLADDGGLFISEKIPNLDYLNLFNDSYVEITVKILHSFFNDFTYDELLKLVKSGYDTFPYENKIGIKKVNDTYFMELFHGPTLAFKDMALVILPRLFALAKEKLNIKEEYNILTATSGDTGGAALNGFKNIKGVNLFVLYPNDGISELQQKQMLSFKSNNAFVYAIKGNFDDCQKIVKEFFEENKELNITSANSINIGRLIPQIAYYYYTYIQLIKNNEIKINEEVNFSIPTGNFGNLFAAFLAKRMGLPIKHLICASNENKVLTDFFNNGVYNKNREFYKTNSPSMDIIVSSNLERLLYYALNENTELVKEIMNKFNKTGIIELQNPFDFIYAYNANQKETDNTIKKLFESSNYLIDPHTAVAYKAYFDYKKEVNDICKTIIVSTASPYKFSKAVLNALSIEVMEDEMENINKISEITKLKIPSFLSYPTNEKEVYSIVKIKKKLKEMIR